MTEEVTQADIDAVKRFHAESARWMLNAIKNGAPIGEDRDLNHPIYQAFASHRTTSLAAQDGLVEALEPFALQLFDSPLFDDKGWTMDFRHRQKRK